MSAEEFPCPRVVRVYLRQKTCFGCFSGFEWSCGRLAAIHLIHRISVPVLNNRHSPTNWLLIAFDNKFNVATKPWKTNKQLFFGTRFFHLFFRHKLRNVRRQHRLCFSWEQKLKISTSTAAADNCSRASDSERIKWKWLRCCFSCT